jgi:hypothetical protein
MKPSNKRGKYDCKRRDPSFTAFYAHLGTLFSAEMEREEFGKVSAGLVIMYVGEVLWKIWKHDF